MGGTRRTNDPLPLTRKTAPILAALLATALVGPVAVTHGADQRGARLPDLLRQARLVVAGTVTRTATLDDGRLVVADVRPERILKGEPAAGDVPVVEEHDLPSSPQLLVTGQHVLVFLVRAAHTSSLTRALPAGPTYQAPVGGRAGVLSSPSAEAIREAAALVARMVEATTDTTSDTDTRSARARSLAFDELVARHPVVVEDGAAAVGAIADLAASLTDAERRRIEAALRRRDLPVRVRVAVVRLVGARHLTVLAPALGKLEAPAPEVLAASWDALRALGHAPAAVDLAPFVASRDAGVRAVAVAALLATAGADAIPQVERLALEDPDVAVRTAATQALGTSRLPAALPALAHVYKASPWDVRRAAGNAIVGWGDDDAAATLARLTFEAPPEAQKWALALLLSLGRTKADPLVDHIRTSHPDPTLRDIIDHGFDLGTEHHE